MYHMLYVLEVLQQFFLFQVESGPGRVSAANRDTNISSNSKTNGRPNTQHRLAQHDTDGPSCFIARATSTKSQRNTAVMPSEAGNFDTCETGWLVSCSLRQVIVQCPAVLSGRHGLLHTLKTGQRIPFLSCFDVECLFIWIIVFRR